MIRPATSTVPQTCWRCSDLGLPPDGIAPGEEHLIVESESAFRRCCLDCFERLAQECAVEEG